MRYLFLESHKIDRNRNENKRIISVHNSKNNPNRLNAIEIKIAMVKTSDKYNAK